MPDPSYTSVSVSASASECKDIIAKLFLYPDVAALHRNMYDGGKWYDTLTYIIPRMNRTTIKATHLKNYGDAIYVKVAAMPHETRTIDALAEFIADSMKATVPANMHYDVMSYVSDRVEIAGLVYTPPPPPVAAPKPYLPYRQRIIRAAMESFNPNPEMYAHIRMEPVHMPDIQLSLRPSPAAAATATAAPPRRVRAWTTKMNCTCTL